VLGEELNTVMFEDPVLLDHLKKLEEKYKGIYSVINEGMGDSHVYIPNHLPLGSEEALSWRPERDEKEDKQ